MLKKLETITLQFPNRSVGTAQNTRSEGAGRISGIQATCSETFNSRGSIFFSENGRTVSCINMLIGKQKPITHHSFIFSEHFRLGLGWADSQPILGTQGTRHDYTLDGFNTLVHTHLHTKGQPWGPIHLPARFWEVCGNRRTRRTPMHGNSTLAVVRPQDQELRGNNATHG